MNLENWLGNFQKTIVQGLLQNGKANILVYRYFDIANQRVRLNFTTPYLAKLFSTSLLHLECFDGKIFDVEIFVWERELSDHSFRNFTTEISESQESSHLLFHFTEQVISIYDRKNKRAFFWIKNLAELGSWHLAKPFRTLFHWILSESSISMLHGAVVATENGGVLITAKGGSGKTTTALAFVLNGGFYLSDDYAAISPENKRVYSLYNSAMLTDDNLNRFAIFKPFVRNLNRLATEKSLINICDTHPDLLRRSVNLKAILIPTIAKISKSEIVKVNKVKALMAIVPTIRSLKNFEQEKLSAAKIVVDSLPCYQLNLSTDMTEVAQTIKHFINQ
jgi:hypothetical protein